MTWLSLNCREHQGQSNRTHDCRGCDCRCHHKPAPTGFRAMVESAKPLVLDPVLWHVGYPIVDQCADHIECAARENVGEKCCGRWGDHDPRPCPVPGCAGEGYRCNG